AAGCAAPPGGCRRPAPRHRPGPPRPARRRVVRAGRARRARLRTGTDWTAWSDPVHGAAVVGEVLGQAPGQVQTFEYELDAGRRPTAGWRVAEAEPVEHLRQARQRADLAEQLAGADQLAGLDAHATVALGDQVGEAGQVEPGEVRVERLGGGGTQQVGEDLD